MAADYLLQEDGSSRIVLEDSSGNLILESSTASSGNPYYYYLNEYLVGGR